MISMTHQMKLWQDLREICEKIIAGHSYFALVVE